MSASLAEGTIFAGRYRVVRSIAAGGMGAVYEVVHLETDRRRAMKVMHAHLFQSDDMRMRFQREARIAANIESEYLIDVSDAGVDEATGMPFMVMELLRGEELGQRLKRVGRLALIVESAAEAPPRSGDALVLPALPATRRRSALQGAEGGGGGGWDHQVAARWIHWRPPSTSRDRSPVHYLGRGTGCSQV